MLTIEKGLYPFWAGGIADPSRTTAYFSIDPISKTEELMRFDQPWEEVCASFVNILRDGGLYRLYYHVWNNEEGNDRPQGVNICCAESRDGRHWIKPNLGLVEFRGSTDNNILLKNIDDNFTVMLDDNPACPPEERYKALASASDPDRLCGAPYSRSRHLVLLTSPDGLVFTKKCVVSDGYDYDSMNNLVWSSSRGKYFCYFRHNEKYAESPSADFDDRTMRRIMVTSSADLMSWSEPKCLDYGDSDDYPMYTNGIIPYLYDSRYLVGFPTRYNQRREWNDSYERLCGKEPRLERMKGNPRYGLAITDTVFMCSTDGEHFVRYDEAFITPGIEREGAWEYGSCYPALGCPVETRSPTEGDPPELSFYLNRHPWKTAGELLRFSCRRDGFASYKADYAGKTLCTLPVKAAGGTLKINFATSARGHIRVRALDEGGAPIDGYESCALFGDTAERTVDFKKPFSELSGRIIRLGFEMKDARIYAFSIGD